LKVWSDSGWADVFRHKNPTTEVYSWWDVITGARARNVGWRIDSAWVMKKFADIVFVEYKTEQMGSDHCSVVVSLE
jgi:exodeoxyribonuclease-3